MVNPKILLVVLLLVCLDATLTRLTKANFPNLRRLFIESRSDDEEREVSRKAVRVHCVLSLYRYLLGAIGSRSLMQITDIRDTAVLQRRPLHGLGRCLQPDRAADERHEIDPSLTKRTWP